MIIFAGFCYNLVARSRFINAQELVMLKSTRTAIALLIVFACAGIVRAVEDKKPTVKLKSIAVKRIALANQTAETTVAIEIQNPGPAFKIKDASYQLKLNGQPAAEGK